MNNNVRYEYKKASIVFKRLIVTNLVVNLLSLLFFYSVGKFDTQEVNSILTDSSGVITLAATLTISVAVIYGVVIFNKYLLTKYIGVSRERYFLYPSGRSKIFQSILISLLIHFTKSLLPVLIVNSMLFYYLSSLAGASVTSLPSYVMKVFCIVLFITAYSLLMILVSILLGQVFQSTNVSLVVSIIIVAIFGNIIANLYRLDNALLILLSVGSILLILGVIKYISARIRVDDIFVKGSRES